MQTDPLVILSQGIVLGETVVPDHARDRLRLRHALLLHQQFEGSIAPAAGRHLEHAGLLAVFIEDRPDAQALQQSAPSDTLRQLLDPYARPDAANVGLAQDQLVEGNVTRGTEFDFLNGACHIGRSTTGGRKTLSRPPTRHGHPGPSLTLQRAATTNGRDRGRMHHAASSSPSPPPSIACGTDSSTESATFEAALAAATTARLSSRRTFSHEPM